MGLVLAFFFLQKDLGPALVLTLVFLGLYSLARGKLIFVLVSLGLLFGAFALAYRLGYPPTVGQRVAMWLDPWANALPGGNQIAQGYWALASGALAQMPAPIAADGDRIVVDGDINRTRSTADTTATVAPPTTHGRALRPVLAEPWA